MLAYVSDEANRRRVLVQLNRTEGRHDQLGALGLVVNAIALFNTRYLDRAVNHVRDRGESIDDHDLERLSPLVPEHIELHGRYSFSLPEAVLSGELRPLPRRS